MGCFTVTACGSQGILKLEGRLLRHATRILIRQFFIANGSQIAGKANRIDKDLNTLLSTRSIFAPDKHSCEDIKLRTVAGERIGKWCRRRLHRIDAGTAMSPIGGIGVNVAVRATVAAANIRPSCCTKDA